MKGQVKMGLLAKSKLMNPDDLDHVRNVLDSIRSRVDYLDDSEPDSYGGVHDTWESNRDELEEIADELEELLDKNEDEPITQDDLDDIIYRLSSHQSEYGGLKMWVG